MRSSFWLFAAAWAATSSAPAQPVRVINDPTRLDWGYYGNGYALKPVTGLTIAGGAAVEVKVDRGDHPYDAGTNIPLTGAIHKGRDYVVRFLARSVGKGDGEILVRFFRNSEPYPGFGDMVVRIGRDWQPVEVTARATLDIPAGQAAVGLQLAGKSQTLQLGQAHVVEGSTTLSGISLAPAANDPLPPQLAGKGELLNDPLDRQWVTYGAALKTEATSTDVYTRRATLLSVSKAGAQPYDAGVNVPVAGAIRKGDPLLVAVLMRSRNAEGSATVSLRAQSNQDPYPGWGEEALHPASGWKLFQWRTTAQMDLPAGQGEIAIHAGTAAQSVEIGPVYVVRLPAGN